MNFLEAVEKVLEVMNCDIESEMNITDEHIYQNTQKKVRGEFVQPRRAYTNKNVYAYLTKTRGILPADQHGFHHESAMQHIPGMG